MQLGRYVVLTQVGAGLDGIAFRARGVEDGWPVEIRVLAEAKAVASRWNVLSKRDPHGDVD